MRVGKDTMIPIAEIFGPTIQGEGPHVGMKTLFVRVVGCDFHCAWCDSKFAWKVDSNTKIYEATGLVDELINKCFVNTCTNVVLTGGNPCLYDFEAIIDNLHAHGITVDVETQGSILPKWLSKVDLLVISPKAPSSHQPDVYRSVSLYLDSITKPHSKVAIKIPVFNEEDFQFAVNYYALVEHYKRKDVDIDLYLSVGNSNTTEEGDISHRVLTDYKKLIERVSNSEMKRVFILPQIHTLVWGNKQGV